MLQRTTQRCDINEINKNNRDVFYQTFENRSIEKMII